MKRLVFLIVLCLPFFVSAQTKIKETDVPKSVLLSLEKTYEAYKVKTWYQAPGQYIADIVIDGQPGRSYFTDNGDWQYSTFPTEIKECPTLMNTYFVNNYPGYRIKNIDYVEEMSGDNYYRMIVVRKGVGAEDCEMVFDTRGKLMKSNAPDPDEVKADYYARNNPEDRDLKKRPKPEEDMASSPKEAPSNGIVAAFTKKVPPARISQGPDWVKRGSEQFVAYYSNNQKIQFEAVYNTNTEKAVMTGKVLPKERYTNAIIKYLNEKYKGEKYTVEKMVVYEYDSKYRDETTGKKPKPYTYVVVSQKVKGVKKPKYTRMEFDNSAKFIGLLAAPLDEYDIQ